MENKSVVQEIIELNKKKIGLLEQLIKENPLVSEPMKPLLGAVQEENKILGILDPMLTQVGALSKK
jgi:hypothetical protein